MTKKAAADEPELEPIRDHFTPGEPGAYTHADAIARAAAYVPPPDEAAPESTEGPQDAGPPDSPADAGVKE